MHSSETLAAPPATGPHLLLQLGRLITRARSTSPPPRQQPIIGHQGYLAQRERLFHAKLLAAKPSTSKQVQIQPKTETDAPKVGIEAQLNDRVHALWNEQIPICIEVLLAPNCPECYTSLSRVEEDASYDKLHSQQRALLLERWTMRALVNKTHETPAFITSQWLLNAVRSQLHFSQLSAWLARLKESAKTSADTNTERRRKLSRETCNFKKLESNCEEEKLPANEEQGQRKLNIVYSIKIPGESYKMAEFIRPPTDHTFPITDIGNNVYLKVILQSLPRTEEVPAVKCTCPPKRRLSKDTLVNVYDEITGKLRDLTIGPRGSKFSPDLTAINSNIGIPNRRLSIISNSGSTEYLYSTGPDKENKKSDGANLVDDRMHTPCSESGKHKCNCDDESDGKENHRSSTSLSHQETKKLDERRLKEIAKYKRRLRKESKLKKLCDSTSSEGDGLQKTKETHTSIPILQAARFDRFRAIGCYRNQTYLTLPASRFECKSPFIDSLISTPTEYKKTNTVSTQTDELVCQCGSPLLPNCGRCFDRGMVRSEANYNLASLNRTEPSKASPDDEYGARRKREDEEEAINKKHKCDNFSFNLKCDISSVVSDSFSSFSDKGAQMAKKVDEEETIIKRPKLRRFFPIVDRIEKIVSDRFCQKDVQDKDIEELHLKNDDTVFSRPQPEKRQKTYSINEEDYVLYEKCDYGPFDKCDAESPKEVDKNGFKFPDLTKEVQDSQVPSPTEMDRFRWRFDSASSMVFHTKTGLPLTSSPAPLRRGNNCFDFDESINGITGIKSALFHPISSPSPAVVSTAQSTSSHRASTPTTPITPTTPTIPITPTTSTTSTTSGTQPVTSKKEPTVPKLKMRSSGGLLGSFEECALQGRLRPVATVQGFTAELAASGAFCPPHRRLPVTVFFYAPGGTNAPYMGHIALGAAGYRVSRAGSVQLSLFNPHGTLVNMFVVLYELRAMPPRARTFLRQRTLYLPAGAPHPPTHHHKWLRYLIHLRFMTSKSGKLYLHTDIRIIVSRKSDLDTATAHSAIFRPLPTTQKKDDAETTSQKSESSQKPVGGNSLTTRTPNRVFGGCSEFDSEVVRESSYENQNGGVAYELKSFTYAPDNPKYSPR